jgi:hypothetical protein
MGKGPHHSNGTDRYTKLGTPHKTIELSSQKSIMSMSKKYSLFVGDGFPGQLLGPIRGLNEICLLCTISILRTESDRMNRDFFWPTNRA